MRFQILAAATAAATCAAACAVIALPASAQAPRETLTAADSALVARLLLAEEHRDTSTAAYAAGMNHIDGRIRVIARRGWLRSRDPVFARRDSLPQLPEPPLYPDPAWRVRYRALGNKNDNCDDIRTALDDNSWHVRLRAADLVSAACANDVVIVTVLRTWVKGLPRTSDRKALGVSWQAAAHGMIGLAHIAQTSARQELIYFRTSLNANVRIYAARAATILNDTSTLRFLVADPNDNVKEAAIVGLTRIAGHSADDLLLGVLTTKGYQAIRAAANALKDTRMRDAALSASIATAIRLKRDNSETSRDARRALVDRIAQFATPADWPRIAPLGADFDCHIATAVAELGKKLGDASAQPKR